ncbi:hypothetical protein Tco_0050357, partial [Tanacetum coccineum]
GHPQKEDKGYVESGCDICLIERITKTKRNKKKQKRSKTNKKREKRQRDKSKSENSARDHSRISPTQSKKEIKEVKDPR